MANSMRLNLIMGLVDKITAPIQKVTDETTRMGEKIKGTQGELAKLGSTSRDIEHFRALEERSGRTGAALAAAQARAQALGRELSQTAAPSARLTREFERAAAEVRRLESRHQSERLELQRTGQGLREAGVQTGRLEEATRRIEHQTRRYNEQLAKEQKALDAVAERQKRVADIQQRSRDMKMSATADAIGVGAAIFGAKKLVEAYGEVATARNDGLALGLDEAGIDSITAKAKAFSDMWSGTTQAEFIDGAVEIKSAIDTLGAEAIGDFTRIAALVGKATKSSTAEMTSLMSTGYGVYRRQFDEFGKSVIAGWEKMGVEERDIEFGKYFAAGLVECVNVFKSDGAQMSAALSNLGAAATSANVSFAEQLAILGQLQLTMSGSEAATKYRSFIGAAAGAGKKLSLDFMDANDNLKSMPEILEELRDKYGDTLDAIESQELKKAFGTDEAVALIKLLYPEIDSLKGNIKGMGEALKTGMDTTNRMAEVMNSGPNEAMQLMGQRIQNASIALGETLAPTVIAVSDAVGRLAQLVGGLAERFPFLTQVAVIAVTGLIGLKIASIAARFGLAFMMDGALLAGQAITALSLANIRANAALLVTRVRALASGAALIFLGTAGRAFAVGAALMTAAQWALNVAMSANPIGLIIIGIAALVALVVVLVRKWGDLAPFFSGLWARIKAAFLTAWDVIKTLLSFTPLGLVIRLWQPLAAFFSGLWGSVKGIFSAAWDFIKALMNFAFLWGVYLIWEPLVGFFSGLWDRIKAVFGSAWGFLKAALAWTPLGLVIQAWEPLLGFFSGLWERIKAVFASAKEWLGGILSPVTAFLEKVGGFLKGGAVEVTQKIKASTEAINASLPPGHQATAAVPVGAPVPGAPSVGIPAAAGRAAGSTNTANYNVTVNGAPGMSEEQLAQKVKQELDARERAQARNGRGRLADG